MNKYRNLLVKKKNKIAKLGMSIIEEQNKQLSNRLGN